MTDGRHSSLERRLALALGGETRAAAMPEGLLRVPDRWVRGRPVRTGAAILASAAVVVVAAVGTLAVVRVVNAPDQVAPAPGSGAVDWGVGVPIEDLDFRPEPGEALHDQVTVGPVLEVARGSAAGDPFGVTVYHETHLSRTCLKIVHGSGPAAYVGAGCWGLTSLDERIIPGATMQGGSALTRPALPVVGMVAADAAEVWIETREGRASAVLIPLEGTGVDAHAFIAFLPPEIAAEAIVAGDGSGNELYRTPPHWAVPSPDPTSAPGG